MAYFAPYIDETGIHVPTYNDILEDLISQMKNIFGQDIYIGEDTQDYQQISIFAKKIFDTNSLAVLVYNNRTPNTSIGTGLDNLCSLVGIKRKPATYSTCQVTINGDAGTVIQNGQVSDGQNIWNLPSEVTIPDNGIITVETTSETPGSITALPNTITTIVTPVYGWIGVTNNFTASPGTNQETDAQLRGRFSNSTLAPSSSIFDGMLSSIEGIQGVTRTVGYENDTGTQTSEGFPAHSVTFVVEGGADGDVAKSILNKKTPGCYTNGTTAVEVLSENGNINIIRFYRPTYKNIYVKITLKKLAGYNDIAVQDIQNAVVNYINTLQIAEDVYRSIVWSVATSTMDSIQSPSFSITDVQFSTDGSTYSPADILTNFNEAAVSAVGQVQVVVQ